MNRLLQKCVVFSPGQAKIKKTNVLPGIWDSFPSSGFQASSHHDHLTNSADCLGSFENLKMDFLALESLVGILDSQEVDQQGAEIYLSPVMVLSVELVVCYLASSNGQKT